MWLDPWHGWNNSAKDNRRLSLQFIIYGSYYAVISVLFLIRGTYTACVNRHHPEQAGARDREPSREVISVEYFWPRLTKYHSLDNTKSAGDCSICLWRNKIIINQQHFCSLMIGKTQQWALVADSLSLCLLFCLKQYIILQFVGGGQTAL